MSEYIWYYTEARGVKGIPPASKIWLTESLNFDSPEPLERDWMKYNPYKHNFPPENELKMPSELNLIIDVNYEPQFDCIYVQRRILAVTDDFLEFLRSNGLDKQMEVANLSIYNRKGNLFTNKSYYAIRIGKFNDKLFDFDENTKKRAAGIKDFFLYPNMKLIEPSKEQNIFFLLEFCYNDCILLTEKAKDYVLANFYSPEIYSVQDFRFAYNNASSDKSKLPQIIES